MGYLQSYAKHARNIQENSMQNAATKNESVLVLAEATVQGDMEAAAQLGQALAPMILEPLNNI